MPELIHHCAYKVNDSEGRSYEVLIYGDRRDDGAWIGWLEFRSEQHDIVLRTDRETSQSSRDALAVWASGLEPAYLEGAFQRAVPAGELTKS